MCHCLQELNAVLLLTVDTDLIPEYVQQIAQRGCGHWHYVQVDTGEGDP